MNNVFRITLWLVLERKGVAIRVVYINCRNHVRTNNNKSEKIVTTKGIRQAKIPFVFIALMGYNARSGGKMNAAKTCDDDRAAHEGIQILGDLGVRDK